MTLLIFTRLFMLACLLQSATYGLTFLLPDLFAQIGGTASDVGSVLGTTALATLLVVLFLGEVAKRNGVIFPLAVSGIFCAASLILFATAASIGALVYLAGVLLGFGWGLFYVIAPIVMAQVLRPEQRVVFFTWLSAFIMAGIGLGPILGYTIGTKAAFYLTSAFCLFCFAVFALLGPHLENLRLATSEVENDLTVRTAVLVMRSPAWRPIVMVGIGASVFAALSNFQTVYAELVGLSYAVFFLVYTFTVIAGRLAMARLIGTQSPYGVIAVLMAVMALAVLVFLIQSPSTLVYLGASGLFGIGYGIAYPIVKAMAANDARPDLLAATLQLFGLSYFIGVFGFPFVAGAVLEAAGIPTLLAIATVLSVIEGGLAFARWRQDKAVRPIQSADPRKIIDPEGRT